MLLDSQFAIDNGMWDGTEATWTEWIGRDVTQEFLHNNASGTGAYQLVEWNDQQTILEAFADYLGRRTCHSKYRHSVRRRASLTVILAIQQGRR